MPRSAPSVYTVYPTGFDDCPSEDRYDYCLEIKDGFKWGWSIRPMNRPDYAMNRQGKLIYERRGHEQNKHRRYPLEEALELAEKYIDVLPRTGNMNFAEFTAWYKKASES